jgi:hypothetical protein
MEPIGGSSDDLTEKINLETTMNGDKTRKSDEESKGLLDEYHVRVSKQSCKQANHLILWGRWSTKMFFFLDFFHFFLKKNLEKYDLTRPKVPKYSPTS